VTGPVSDGGVQVFGDLDPIVVQYEPPAGYTTVFRMITKRANSAACSLTP
jgi:hypothetical protein